MAQCFDANNQVQPCSAASDAAESSCFDDNAQEVSCGEVGGNNVSGNIAAGALFASPSASNAAQTGAANAGTATGNGPSFLHSLIALVPVAATAYTQTQQAPKQTLRLGPSGISVPGSSASLLLLGALAVGVGLLVYGSRKRA